MPGRSASLALSSLAAAVPSRSVSGNYVSSARECVLLCAMCGLNHLLPSLAAATVGERC